MTAPFRRLTLDECRLWADVIMGEIARDVLDGTYPSMPVNFNQCHEYTDANMYGDVPDAAPDDGPEWMDNLNEVQHIVDRRLRDRAGHTIGRKGTGKGTTVPHCLTCGHPGCVD